MDSMTVVEKLLANSLEGQGVITVHMWAEIRRLHQDGVSKKQIARNLKVDVRTVRRALKKQQAPLKRQSPARGRKLDAFRERVIDLVRRDPKATAKRIADVLADETGPICERAWRLFVAEIKRELRPKEVFVHRTHDAGLTMEADFGEAEAVIAGENVKVHYLTATLPFCNAYFAKAYRVERLECWMDGLLEAFRFFEGLPQRVVLDNTKSAVKEVLKGRERKEQTAFVAFRGELGLHVDYCAPAKGNEKGSVEGGVKYVRANCFRLAPEFASMAELNESIRAALLKDLPRRVHQACGTAAEALAIERRELRPLPLHWPEACRTHAASVNRFALVRADGIEYSVPEEFAHRSVLVKVFAECVRIVLDDRVIAEHARNFVKGVRIMDWRHFLDLLAKKHRAIPEATALRGLNLPTAYFTLREQLRSCTRHADREWVEVLMLLRDGDEATVTAAVQAALQAGSPRLATIQQILRHQQTPLMNVAPIDFERPDLAAIDVRVPDLSAYDALLEQREEVA